MGNGEGEGGGQGIVKRAWERPSRPRKAWRTGHACIACGEPVPRHELDTDATYSSRDVCGRACMRKVKGTQAERGRMRWMTEEQRL